MKETLAIWRRSSGTTGSGGAVSISAAQMAYMLEGIDWRNPQLTWRPESAG
jgi:transposase